MKKAILSFLPVAILLVTLCGCYEAKEVYTLNPDGSGKVLLQLKATGSPISMNDEDSDPEDDPEGVFFGFVNRSRLILS